MRLWATVSIFGKVVSFKNYWMKNLTDERESPQEA